MSSIRLGLAGGEVAVSGRAESDREVFVALTTNAFEFLFQSISEFEAAPKFSAVHFCAALEMLLKARLMVEHWSLIVAKTENANRNDFLKGNFVSVTLDQTLNRLRDVVGLTIPDSASQSFVAVAKHRNKLIHFFHPDLVKGDDARAKIVSEQAHAWFHLHRLMLSWPDFKWFKSQIDEAERGLRGHRKYLGVRFDALKPDLDLAVQRGGKLTACDLCGFQAAVVHAWNSALSRHVCKVCDHQRVVLDIRCPHCGKDSSVSYDRACQHCGSDISTDELANALVDPVAAHVAAKDGDDSYDPGNCGFCDGYHTVVYCQGKYFCVECFEVSDEASHCGWCNELNTGDMEDSHYHGCNHCDGYSGHTRDD